MKKIILFALLVLSSCATTTKNPTYRELHPEMYIEFHKISEDLKFEDKLKVAPKEYLDEFSRLSKLENTKNWLVFNPQNSVPTQEQINFINREIVKIPQLIKNLTQQKFYYWSLVSKLGAAGLTVPVYLDQEFNTRKNVILINNDNLEMNYCDYVKIKEGSVYQKGEYQVGCTTNKPISKFLFIMLHEIGHVISVTNYLIPHIENINSAIGINWYTYSRLSWKWDGKNYVVPQSEKMEDWQSIRKYYSVAEKDKRPNQLIVDDFNAWKKSSFASMYSAFSPEEDWAEFFNYIILKKYMGIEIKYTLMKNGKVIDEISPCYENPVCHLKKKFMEFYIDNPSIFP